MSRLTTITAGALAVLAIAPAASQGSAPDDLFLGRTSGGAALDYQLDRTPRSQVVTIAGQRARIRLVTEDDRRFYRAFVRRSGLRAGRTYRVTIRATFRNGAEVVKRTRLVLHRSLNRPRAG